MRYLYGEGAHTFQRVIHFVINSCLRTRTNKTIPIVTVLGWANLILKDNLCLFFCSRLKFRFLRFCLFCFLFFFGLFGSSRKNKAIFPISRRDIFTGGRQMRFMVPKYQLYVCYLRNIVLIFIVFFFFF